MCFHEGLLTYCHAPPRAGSDIFVTESPASAKDFGETSASSVESLSRTASTFAKASPFAKATEDKTADWSARQGRLGPRLGGEPDPFEFVILLQATCQESGTNLAAN